MDEGFANFIKKQLEKNSCLGLGIVFLYSLVRKPTTQSIITVLMTAINSLNFAYSNSRGFLLRTGIIIFLDIIVSVGINLVNKRDKINSDNLLKRNMGLEYELDQQKGIITDVIKINRNCSFHLYKLSERIGVANSLNKECNIQDMKNIFSMVSLSKEFCELTYKLFKNQYKTSKINVILYMQFPKNNQRTFIMPISFANELNTQPSVFRERYDLFTNEKNKYLIVKLFEAKSNDNKILLTPEEIYKEVAYDEDNDNRNETIKHYIGIPIRNRNGNIAAVMQLTFSEEILPKDCKDKLDEFIQSNLCPYLSLLEFVYEQEHIIDIMNDIIVKNRSNKHEIGAI